MDMLPGKVTVTVNTTAADGRQLIAPIGMETPHGCCTDMQVTGGRLDHVTEQTTGQDLVVITPETDTLSLIYDVSARSGNYPDSMFEWRENRYTRAADDLVAEMQVFASDLTGIARIRAIACHAAEIFTYGHPEERFNDGLDEIPMLGCGLTQGSCVDINTWFIAAVRAAGFEAGYITGYFFPEEKGGICTDMHCWVVTRTNGRVQEWDIAHHLKMGRKNVAPGLNPKPGWRMALAHSMGWDVPEIGLEGLKLVAEPFWANSREPLSRDLIQIKWDKSTV